MKYHEAVTRALEWGDERCRAELKSLAKDERWAAVVAWLEGNIRAYSVAVADQRRADKAGSLAHCAGSLYALQLLRSQARALMEGNAPVQNPMSGEEPEAV